MRKKLELSELDPESDLPTGYAPRPARNSGNTRKSASHSSNKRKRTKATSRKGNSAQGGIHQRGDKRVMR